MVYFGASDVGKTRKSNQDAFVCSSPARNVTLCTVCDGMGGAGGGNVASALACKTFAEKISAFIEAHTKDGMFSSDSMQIRRALIAGAEAANTRVFEESQSSPALSGMGTTLVAALFYDGFVHVVNVGDSRLYFISDTEFRQITHDHSYVQYLVDNGVMTAEEAESNPKKNIITRAVGTESTVEPDTFSVSCGAGGYFLLCSDGLTNFVRSDTIRTIVTGSHPESVQEKVAALIDAANRSGGGDNITAVLIAA